MHDKAVSSRNAVLARAAALAGSEKGFARFLAAAASASDAEDLAGIAAENFESILRQSYVRVLSYEGQTSAVSLSPPSRPGEPLVIDVISPDMPFIVDSVMAALRASGGATRLFAHPVVRIADGDVADSGKPLSVLHIHSDPVADPGALKADIETSMADVARAVGDWQPMLERVRQARADLTRARMPAALRDEAVLFLEWLAENNFTFLGLREYRLENGSLAPLPESGLGTLRDPDFKVLRSGPDFIEATPRHADFMAGAEPLLVTKANVRARVHRRVHMDYVGIKLYGADGEAIGELRLVGLFTAQAQALPHTEVPLIRRKIGEVMKRSGFDPMGHDGRTLLSALNSYPRDELFQIDTDQLAEFAHAIAGLFDRPRVRVLPRIDRFDNFVSILVYVPRDRYDSQARANIAQYLAEQYEGRVSAYYPHFLESELVRVHIIIGRNGGPTPQPARADLEARVEALTSDFGDALVAAAADPANVSAYRNAFSAAYQSRHSAHDAIADIGILEGLGTGSRVAMVLRERHGRDGALGIKFYHHGQAIPLSDRVPLLEHFGFRVIDERTYTVLPRDGVERYIHDMVIEPLGLPDFDAARLAKPLQRGLLAVWEGLAENDALNTLVAKAGLEWDEAALLRAFSRYLRQVGISYSQRYIASVLVAQPVAAGALVRLFAALHNPAGIDAEAADAARQDLTAALDAMASLDEDRIVRRLLNLVEASLRTNIFQRAQDGSRRPALAIKFDSAAIEGMPAPRPYREIFVYSPRVEGVHLRFGAIARGGIRWSDRPEDFRTEVLGLVKAQQVKNAVIVPVGAKGGFVPKRLVPGMAREAFQAEGIASYTIFISSLLDITDNLVGGEVVPPAGTARRDGDDPYLVVAADKGTASFSDTANGIAREHGFWLDDAFASGGSVGYDHKKMGITARGGWEAVKRHFREMDRDIQAEPVTVVGVGDMSGDVFGNGMLLSRQIHLVAAFDHRDIFLDPNPDPERSFAERQRLFALSRSSWQDYDRSLISAGGGVFSRSLKSVPLSPEVRARLGLNLPSATPAEIMTAILLADVDLLWFGGIGTYLRSSQESDADVGDRANDAIRITAPQVRARVIGEGANLGVTQRARVEYGLLGGRINSDAIDNSAGVNSSDLEVNIKIALAPVVASGTLTQEARNAFLATMTDEVAALCLRNNYLQTLALSLAQREGLSALPAHRQLMSDLEARGLLDRRVEFLPSEAALDERAATGKALTRPELAVLLAYAKLTTYADLLEGQDIDDAYLGGELSRYFPEKLHAAYPDAITHHRLKREVIATVLANAMINQGGPAFVSELAATTSAGPGEIALAYAVARDIYGLIALNARIDALDGKVPGAVQLDLYAQVEALLHQETLWFLRNADVTTGLQTLVARHGDGVTTLRAMLGAALPQALSDAVNGRVAGMVAAGIPADLAREVAELSVLSYASDIVLVSERCGVSITAGASAFFGVFALFDLWPVLEQGHGLVLSDRFERMALDRALANLMRAQRDLTAEVLSVAGGIQAWQEQRRNAVDRTRAAVADLTKGSVTVSRLSVAAGLLADLAREV